MLKRMSLYNFHLFKYNILFTKQKAWLYFLRQYHLLLLQKH